MYVNSERRVSRLRKVSDPPGLAKPDWEVFKEIARRMGHDWTSKSAQELWDNEISQLAPQLAGIKYSRIEGDGLNGLFQTKIIAVPLPCTKTAVLPAASVNLFQWTGPLLQRFLTRIIPM